MLYRLGNSPLAFLLVKGLWIITWSFMLYAMCVYARVRTCVRACCIKFSLLDDFINFLACQLHYFFTVILFQAAKKPVMTRTLLYSHIYLTCAVGLTSEASTQSQLCNIWERKDPWFIQCSTAMVFKKMLIVCFIMMLHSLHIIHHYVEACAFST